MSYTYITNSLPLPDKTVIRYIVTSDPSRYASKGKVFDTFGEAQIHKFAMQISIDTLTFYVIELHYTPEGFKDESPPLAIFVYLPQKDQNDQISTDSLCREKRVRIL